VTVGDVIYIEANSGAVKRVGRCDVYSTQYELEAEEYVPLPKGDVHKKKEIVQDVTLHDLDVANAKPQVQFSPFPVCRSGFVCFASDLVVFFASLVVCSSGRCRHSVDDGFHAEAQEDRNHRKVAIGNQ
jgi:hypothetical protein